MERSDERTRLQKEVSMTSERRDGMAEDQIDAQMFLFRANFVSTAVAGDKCDLLQVSTIAVVSLSILALLFSFFSP